MRKMSARPVRKNESQSQRSVPDVKVSPMQEDKTVKPQNTYPALRCPRQNPQRRIANRALSDHTYA